MVIEIEGHKYCCNKINRIVYLDFFLLVENETEKEGVEGHIISCKLRLTSPNRSAAMIGKSAGVRR